jgi:4-amino-4-deoxychorismate lyase
MSSQLHLWNIWANIDLKTQILSAFDATHQGTTPIQELYKCRVLYDMAIQTIEFIPYHPQLLDSLQIMPLEQPLDYALKYADRSELNRLKSVSRASDILLTKNDCLLDISYANVAFNDGENWITPKHPLLKGTKRQFLIEKGALIEKILTINDLNKFNQIKTFNALMEITYNFTISYSYADTIILHLNLSSK